MSRIWRAYEVNTVPRRILKDKAEGYEKQLRGFKGYTTITSCPVSEIEERGRSSEKNGDGDLGSFAIKEGEVGSPS